MLPPSSHCNSLPLQFGKIRILHQEHTKWQRRVNKEDTRFELSQLALELTGPDADRFQRVSAPLPENDAHRESTRIAHFLVNGRDGHPTDLNRAVEINDVLDYERASWDAAFRHPTDQEEIDQLGQLVETLRSSYDTSGGMNETVVQHLEDALRWRPWLRQTELVQ